MVCDPLHRNAFTYFHSMTSRWRDNDVYAHVNNAVFYEYIDTAVNYWIIREGGLAVPTSPVIGLVVNSTCDFFAPLRFPDEITAGVSVSRIGRTSVAYRVGLFAGADGTSAAISHFTHVYVDKETRQPVPLSKEFVGALQKIIVSETN